MRLVLLLCGVIALGLLVVGVFGVILIAAVTAISASSLNYHQQILACVGLIVSVPAAFAGLIALLHRRGRLESVANGYGGDAALSLPAPSTRDGEAEAATEILDVTLAFPELNRAETCPILVVDDDPQVLRMARLVLTRRGYAPDIALGGREAIARLTKRVYDLLLTDYKCGGGDAPAVVAAARSRNPMIRLVIISSDRDIAALASELDADDYLGKPYEFDDLARVVGKFIGGNRP